MSDIDIFEGCKSFRELIKDTLDENYLIDVKFIQIAYPEETRMAVFVELPQSDPRHDEWKNKLIAVLATTDIPYQIVDSSLHDIIEILNGKIDPNVVHFPYHPTNVKSIFYFEVSLSFIKGVGKFI